MTCLHRNRESQGRNIFKITRSHSYIEFKVWFGTPKGWISQCFFLSFNLRSALPKGKHMPEIALATFAMLNSNCSMESWHFNRA